MCRGAVLTEAAWGCLNQPDPLSASPSILYPSQSLGGLRDLQGLVSNPLDQSGPLISHREAGDLDLMSRLTGVPAGQIPS